MFFVWCPPNKLVPVSKHKTYEAANKAAVRLSNKLVRQHLNIGLKGVAIPIPYVTDISKKYC